MTTDDAPKYIPRRGDEVEAWLDEWVAAFVNSDVPFERTWGEHFARMLLADYIAHADANDGRGVPLSEEVPRG